MSWQFHFRNFNNANSWWGVYHLGCGGAPWHDGRPRCWEQVIPYNPTGGHDSVYVPSDWVVHFGNWFQVILDGLKLIADVGIFIASGGEDEDALTDALQDAFNVTEDVIKGVAEENQVNLGELAKQARASFAKTCASIGYTPAQISGLAQQMGLKPNWVFIAGNTYQQQIRCNSKVVDDHGWTVLLADPADGDINWLANHAFIESGHIIQAYHPQMKNGLWQDWATSTDPC